MFAVIGFAVLLWVLAYWSIPLPLASLAIGAWTVASAYVLGGPWAPPLVLLVLGALLVLNWPWARRRLLSRWAFAAMRGHLPAISSTEQEALEAGNTWWDAELFSGRPDWKILDRLIKPVLSEAEQAFLAGPTEQLCAMLDDWNITHRRRDLPPEVWSFIKENGFWALIIPKTYGGLEFCHFAHSQIVEKIASRSIAAAVTVMVPNSLGPAKLLMEYGTDEQKSHYLPRLANGTEIPCFALTGPTAGSDAGAIPDMGVVCRGRFDGRDDVLGIRLNWDKRYITLGPVATVLGLAFKLFDPDRLLGGGAEPGITLALVPTHLPGIEIGHRHWPLESGFQNGPNRGRDVFIPVDWIIGGRSQAGNGWRMLVECLAVGRGISLPALSTGGAKLACRNTGAYARVRTQFHRPIGQLEGVEELLARMAGETYVMDAARRVTLAALDEGQKPSVVSAIVKYELTERMRRVVNDAMDVQGGSGICMGPRNYLGSLYEAVPISITVEGANVLTRTLMIFGQGAVRCHPFLQRELEALQIADQAEALRRFDRVLVQHAGFFLRNLAASLWLGLTGARLLQVFGTQETRRYCRAIARLSAGFALAADFGLLTLGGTLKQRERISGRFADVLSNLYLCSCVLTHYRQEGCREEDRPLLDWACRHTIYQAQQALWDVFGKLPLSPLAWLLRTLVFPFGKTYGLPGDRLEHRLASLLLNETPARERLTEGVFVNTDPRDATGRIEVAFKAVLAAAPVEAKLRRAQKQGRLDRGASLPDLANQAVAAGLIGDSDREIVLAAEKARAAAIAVDEFAPDLSSLPRSRRPVRTPELRIVG